MDHISTKAEKVYKDIENKHGSTEMQRPTPFDPREHEDKTRSRLASIFVWGYFVVLSISILLAIINNIVVQVYKLDPKIVIDVKDMISAISGAVGISLGFVVGYYFKSSEMQKEG
jgi:hypothetical protein